MQKIKNTKSPTSLEVKNNQELQILQDYLTSCSWIDYIADELNWCKEAQRNASGKNKRNAGRRGYDPCFMLKICHFQREFGLSDKKMVIRIYDSCLLKLCLGIESPDDIPSEETIRNYRKLFAQDDFMDKVFQKATAIMQEQAEAAVKENAPVAAA